MFEISLRRIRQDGNSLMLSTNINLDPVLNPTASATHALPYQLSISGLLTLVCISAFV
jgi:hypothetical protein